LKWALAHWPGPIHPTGSNPTGQDLGRSNRPRPALSPHLSPSSSPANPSRRRRRPTIPASSGGFCRRCLGQNGHLYALYHLLQLDSAVASFPTRSWWFPDRVLPALSPPISMPRRVLSSVLDGVSVVVVTLVQCRWQRRGALLPVCSVKTSPGSPWLAARALPRHAIQACAWASGECVASSSPTFCSLAIVTGHLAMIICAKLTDFVL
jgi:hypothetical protein